VNVAELAPPARPENQPTERDLKNHLRNDTTTMTAGATPPSVEGDYPLRTAVDYLKAIDIFKASTDSGKGKGTTSRRD
jgi:carboxyl-terminal processing protease